MERRAYGNSTFGTKSVIIPKNNNPLVESNAFSAEFSQST
jgi:hypothetical protein